MRRGTAAGWFAWGACVVLLAIGIGVLTTGPAEARVELRLNRVDSFVAKFPVKKAMNRAYRPQLDALQAAMHRRMAAGENLACSTQIFDEIHWLVNFTDRRDAVEQRMADLRESLNRRDQSFATRQDPADGSFGPCYSAWFLRFDASVDPLKALAREGKQPEVPLTIWDPVDTPDEVRAVLREALISDLSSGYNKRKELNKLVTALGQLLWLDDTAAVFPDHLDRQALAEALRKFVDDEWQDRETGYWGAWYEDGGTLHKTNDLSITFHIVSYRGGDVRHLDKIAATTFAIRNVPYPYGWDTGGTQNNHHAYDVARIINLAWDRLDATARAHASAAVYLMGARSLAMSINDDGMFDPRPFTGVGEAFYFGIAFFEQIGLFGNDVDLSTGVYVTNTAPLLRQIEDNLSRLHPSDPWVIEAKHKLDTVKRSLADRQSARN